MGSCTRGVDLNVSVMKELLVEDKKEVSMINIKEISVVDISDIGLSNENPTEMDFKRVGSELGSAFSKIGFVYLSGHGIVDGIIDDAMRMSKIFFELQEDEKRKISRPSPLARDGWVSPGRETFKKKGEEKVHELREAFDMNCFDEDMKFPENPPEFKIKLKELATQSVQLSHRLLKCISLAL